MTAAKICGITNIEDALAVTAAGASAIGLNFAPSPRRVTVEKACEIASALPPFITRVGLFVNEDLQAIKDMVARVGLDAVQLHGDESPEFAEALRPIRVIKAVRIADRQDVRDAERYPGCTILFDAKSKRARGGTGIRFDLDLIMDVAYLDRVIVAGGLNPENVATVVQKVRPYAVDVSSGVEMSPGRKDPSKLKRFMQAVRAADLAGSTNGPTDMPPG